MKSGFFFPKKLASQQWSLEEIKEGFEEVLMNNPRGEIGADEIKIIRLMLSADLSVVTRIKDVNDKIKPILMVARALGKVYSLLILWYNMAIIRRKNGRL